MDDPELKLVIAACRSAFRVGDFHVYDVPNVRWDRFARLTQRHRVAALCWEGLGAHRRLLPDAVAASLSRSAKGSAAQSMRMAFECGRLANQFDHAGVDLLFVKGVTLSALSYPKPFLKMSMDIDLLVSPFQLGSAALILRSAGYHPAIPASATNERIKRWHCTRKESVWFSPETGVWIDLHTRLADPSMLLSGTGVTAPRQWVTVANGIALPTLAQDELFAYLCVHGSSSAWFRLKWICDLAAFLEGISPEKIDILYDRSQSLGAGRAAAQALLVTHIVFGTSLSPPLIDRLRSDPVNRWLADIALRQLISEREPLDRKMGTLSIHFSQLLMLPGAKNLLSEFGRQVRSVLDGESR